MWIALSIVAGIALVFYFNRRSAVWGGLTLGAIGGVIAALITGFSWATVGKWAVIGTLIGVLMEFPQIFRRPK